MMNTHELLDLMLMLDVARGDIRTPPEKRAALAEARKVVRDMIIAGIK